MTTGISMLHDYDCKLCNNKGYTINTRHNDTYNYDYEVMIDCECKQIRRTLLNISKSGLADTIADKTLDNFIAKTDWQKKMLEICQNFNNGWLLLCGQPGAGKSHLGTAVMGKFLSQGKKAVYMLWRDDSVKLKAMVNDFENYSKAIDYYKKSEVLYIDDFFKTERGKTPTQADINLAHELINYRYINKLTTIISTELLVAALLNIDEAIGSRIFEMSKKNLIEIGYDKTKNWRLNS